MTLNTVLCVSAFDHSYVKLGTEKGEIEIAGKDLKITDLSKEKKSVILEGEIKDISFSEKNDRSKSLFGGKLR